jgi:excinuclease ABC subunit C
MVDGGKGQLNTALAVLKELKIAGKFAVIGIAKKNKENGEKQDKIYLPGRANPVNFQQHAGQLQLLEKIRDEAHRRAVSFHRKRRKSRSLHSVLDDIEGIGPKRKATLLKYYKSIEAIAAADEDELASLPGMTPKAARALCLNLSDISAKGL